MVKVVHTAVALSAVLGSDWSDCLTRVAHVVDWIVEVIVLTPQCGLTNLCGDGDGGGTRRGKDRGGREEGRGGEEREGREGRRKGRKGEGREGRKKGRRGEGKRGREGDI